MKKVLSILMVMMLVIGVQAQGNSFPDKVDNLKDKLSPATIVGLQYFDNDVLLKKIKVKKPEQKLEVSNLIRIYNSNIKSLESENMDLLTKFGTDIVSKIKNKDFGSIFNSGTGYKKKIEAVRDQSATHLATFEKDLFEATKKRQQKKYYKFKTQRAKELEKSTELGDITSILGL